MEINATEWVDKLNAKYQAAFADVAAANAKGIEIHGKRYTTVARRVETFRKHFGCFGRLRIAEFTDESDVLFMRAVVELLTPNGWDVFAEGRAQEKRGSNQITRTSATEVCETSAYGRALANFGLHGGEFASANEVENAQSKQSGIKPGIGIHSPLGDVDVTDQDKLYASLFINAVKTSDNVRIHQLHMDLHNEGEERYRAVWSLLDSKVRSTVKKVLAEKEAA
jgi:hypothetical protein